MSIEIKNVNKFFGDFVALDDINVSLPTGQLTALLGPDDGQDDLPNYSPGDP